MKLYLFLLLSIGVYAWAELPDTVSDKAINTNLENLDMKTAKAQKDINSVVNTSGAINLGWERKTNGACGTALTCTTNCTSGKKIVGGGCSSSNALDYLYNSFPSDNDTWDCAWTGSAGVKESYAICAKVQ